MLQGASYAVEELVLFERLQNIVVSTATDRFEGGLDIVDGGNHDDGNLGVKGA